MAMDIVTNQQYAGQPTKCVYLILGKTAQATARIVRNLELSGAMEYTTVMVAGTDQPWSVQYLAPFAASSVAEYHRSQSEDALVIYDDLRAHTIAYEQLAMHLKQPSVSKRAVSLYSPLLERAAQYPSGLGGAAVTAIPLLTTDHSEGDFAPYEIDNTLISIVDNHIWLDDKLAAKGIYPAVDCLELAGGSSRSGVSLQRAPLFTLMKKVGRQLVEAKTNTETVSRIRELELEVDEELEDTIAYGSKLQHLVRQEKGSFTPELELFLSMFAGAHGLLASMDSSPKYDLRNHPKLRGRAALAFHVVKPALPNQEFGKHCAAFLSTNFPDLLDEVESEYCT